MIWAPEAGAREHAYNVGEPRGPPLNSLPHPSVPASCSALGCGERASICEEFAAPSDRVARSSGVRSS